jgi:hypothetical protein
MLFGNEGYLFPTRSSTAFKANIEESIIRLDFRAGQRTHTAQYSTLNCLPEEKEQLAKSFLHLCRTKTL